MARNLDINQQLDLPESVKFTTLEKLGISINDDHTSINDDHTSIDSDAHHIGFKRSDLTTTVSNLTRELRCSFTNGMANVCESYVSERLKVKFRKIAKTGRQEAGHNAFLFSKSGEILNGFEFNSEHPFHDVFKAKYFVKNGSNRGHLILHYPAFIPREKLTTPKEASHFKLYTQLVALSDFEFDSEQGYRPISEKFHGRKSEFYSQMLPILKIPIQPITSQLSVNNGMGVPNSSGLLLIMGIHFYRYEDCKYVPMSKESALGIVNVF